MQSKDIYLGAIPWVLLQLMLVVIVIFVPQTVTMFLDKDVKIDIDKVQLDMPAHEETNDKDEQKNVDDLLRNSTKSDAVAAPQADPAGSKK